MAANISSPPGVVRRISHSGWLSLGNSCHVYSVPTLSSLKRKMSQKNEIIVLDDDEDEEEPVCAAKAKATPSSSSKQTNGKVEESVSNAKGKESKAALVSAENKTLFNEFIEYCSKLTVEHPEVITFLQGRYAKANPTYVSSVEFRNTLGRCLTRVQTKRSKIFVYINELCTALKANSQKRKVSLQTQPAQQPAEEKAEPPKDDGEAEESPVKKSGSKRQIRYLENLLRIYSLEINKLQEKELSLEELDDEDSSYIQESRLKRKLLRIFEKLCELKDCSNLTGRVIEQRILYRGTRYPEVNRRLEKFINGSRDLFPDYGDVLRVVERANEKHSLGLSRKQMQSMAQDAFRELGNKLQDRRHLDMIYNFGCHLTDPYKSVNDPAQQDTSLSRRLRENRNTALTRLDDIIKKYAELQEDGDDDYKMKTRRAPERNKESSSSEEEESEDSETDIEEELEQSNEMEDNDEAENEEELISAEQENEADQKLDMASGGEEDREKDKGDGENEEQEDATEQDSSPASTSTSHDKDSSNTTLESEVEAQLSVSSDLPPLANDSPGKAKSDDEQSEEPEADVSPASTQDQMEEDQEDGNGVQSSEDEGLKENQEAATCEANTGEDENRGKYLLPDMTVSLENQDKDNSEHEAEDDELCEGTDAETHSEASVSPAVQEESCTNVNADEPSESRASIEEEEEEVCMVTTGNHGDGDQPDDSADSGDDEDQKPLDSPVSEHEAAEANAHTDASDLDNCENQTDCDPSPLGSSNGVEEATEVQKTPLKHLKPAKLTLRDSPKPRVTKEDSPPPNRKRKATTPEKWPQNNGLSRYNGKRYAEAHKESSRKRAKMDCYSSYSSSSGSDSEIEQDDQTPGLMMTCSPMETPTKPIIRVKTHVSTQCDPDEVIVLSD
ncbi:death domain-associated protein 6 isoform X2 [Engystomops pustulosus]|uniref:death domain-associated protein 6 isoform X2 n=1 Tax=Engystomops pustulosus TaxID=76066 RepID=UPI003AFAD8ED